MSRPDPNPNPQPQAADAPWRPVRAMVLAVATAADGGCLFVVEAEDGRCGVFRQVDGPPGSASQSPAASGPVPALAPARAAPGGAAPEAGAAATALSPVVGRSAHVHPGDMASGASGVQGPAGLAADDGTWRAVCRHGPLTRGDAMVCLAAGEGRAPA